MAKVLITGATGLLGFNTALMFCKQGYEVRLLIRRTSHLPQLEGLFCEIYYGAVEQQTDVDAAIAGCDYVIHAASVTAQWGVKDQTYELVNIKGTKHVISACLRYGIKKLVYISTANTVGPGSKHNPGTELNPFSLFKFNSPYINTKYIAQQKVLEAVVEKGLRAVILNPTFMIGPYDFKPSSGQIFQYVLNKLIIFYPPGGKNFVHVNDVSRAAVSACTDTSIGECILIAGENLTYREFFKVVSHIKKQHPLMFRIPPVVLKIVGITGTIAGRLLKRRLRLNYASACLLCADNYYSGNMASRRWSLNYTPVSTAVEEALEWMRKNEEVLL